MCLPWPWPIPQVYLDNDIEADRLKDVLCILYKGEVTTTDPRSIFTVLNVLGESTSTW